MGINSDHCSHRAEITPKHWINCIYIHIHIDWLCQSFHMITINQSREEKFSCKSETKAPAQYEALSKEFKNPEKKKRNKIDSDLCLHTLIHSTFYCSCQNFEIVQIQCIALHGWLVKLESQTLIVVLPRSLLPLQITLALLSQFYTVLGRIW